MAYKPKEREIVIPGGDPTPWKTRAKAREKLISEYVKQFRNISTIWAEALREGWDVSLYEYVYEVAKVQAQYMHPDPCGIGWNSQILFGVKAHPTKARLWGFLNEQKRQAGQGFIDVAIPTDRIAEWKKRAEWLKSMPQQKSLVSKTLATPKTRIDEEIERQLRAKGMPA